MREDAPQRKYELREVFNALRWIVRAGAPWRMLPTNLPPWEVVYQQTQRWIAAGCFEVRCARCGGETAVEPVTEDVTPNPLEGYGASK